MDLETAAHLTLLSLFEGGNEYWVDEYLNHGAQCLVERISAGEYADYKKSGYKLASALQELNPESLQEQMVASQAFLITRHDSDWPVSLDDLKAPPIALIGRGSRTAIGGATNCTYRSRVENCSIVCSGIAFNCWNSKSQRLWRKSRR